MTKNLDLQPPAHEQAARSRRTSSASEDNTLAPEFSEIPSELQASQAPSLQSAMAYLKKSIWLTKDDSASDASDTSVSVADLTQRKRFEGLISELSQPGTNMVMWNDNWTHQIIDRDATDIMAGVDENVAAMGMTEADFAADPYSANPYALSDPTCGSSAQNIFKLMTENEKVFDPEFVTYTECCNLENFISELDPQKHYALLINEERLGHIYVVDLPASRSVIREAYIIQSDMGDGVLPPLGIGAWMQKRGYESVPIKTLAKLNSRALLDMDRQEWAPLVASVLGLTKDVGDLHPFKVPHRLAVGRGGRAARSEFACQEYDPKVAARNIAHVRSFSTWKRKT